MLWASETKAQVTYNWANKIESYGDRPVNVVTDASGNVYTLGFAQFGGDFDPSPTSSYTLTAGTFVQKLDANGDFVWAKNIEQVPTSPQGVCNPSAICLDGAGNVLITGWYLGIIDVDPSSSATFTLAGINTAASTTARNAFVLKLNAATGNFIWAKGFDGNYGSASSDFFPTGIAVDNANNVFTTGYVNNNTVDFDPSTSGTYTVSFSSSVYESYVTKLDASGNFVWANKYGNNTQHLTNNAIALDAAGNVYFGGKFGGNVDFDASAATFTLSSTGISDMNVTKLNNAGGFIWSKKIGIASQSNYVTALTVDNFGSILLAGYEGTASQKIIKLSPLGNVIWTSSYNFCTINAITTDAIGNVYSTGDFNNSNSNFGSTSVLLSPNGLKDVFISKLDSGGNAIYALKVGSTSNDIGRGIAVTNSYGVYVTGEFNGTADFNPTAGTYTMANTYGVSTFVLKLTSPCTASISVNSGTICSGQSFTFTPSGANSYTYSTGSSVFTPTASGLNYTVTGTTSGGCVGTAISNVSVLTSPTITSVSNSGNNNICSGNSVSLYLSGWSGPTLTSYTWSTGGNTSNITVTPTVTTVYSVVVTNTLGCTSSPLSFTQTVLPAPSVTVTSSAPVSLCAGQSATITITGTAPTSFTGNVNNTTPEIPGGAPSLSGFYVITPTVTTYQQIKVNQSGTCTKTFYYNQVVVDCGPVGINEIDNNNTISIYPNPANDFMTISLVAESADATTIYIVNAIGEIVLAEKAMSSNTTLNTSNLTNGIYFIKVESKNGSAIKKFIKQ